MAMCLRCLQEGKFVDAEKCDHGEPTLTTTKADEKKPAADKKGKK